MQIFELHFNPKSGENRFFDSFVYEPENVYEKKLGNLYLAGDLLNALPRNSGFLDKIAQIIKKSYYRLSFKNQEKALSETLKEVNKFLSEEVRKENVSWLGNLNFAALSLKDFNLTFAKTGNFKILLIRNGSLTDIGKNLEFQDIEPYPLKIFFSTVSGKLALNDIVLVLSKEIYDFFLKQGLLNKISQNKAEELNEKKLKEILPSSLFEGKEKAKISGLCFLIVLNSQKEKQDLIKNVKEIISQKKESFPLIKDFKFNKIKSFFISFFAKKKLLFPKIPYLKNLSAKFSSFLKNSLKFKVQSGGEAKLSAKTAAGIVEPVKKPFDSRKKILLRNKWFLIGALFFILFLGFLIFKGLKIEKEKKIRIHLEQIEKKAAEAENFLIFKKEAKAAPLLKEAWQDISSISEEKGSLNPKILSLKKSIEKNLEKISKLKKITEPTIQLELKNSAPKKMLLSQSKLYFYSPFSKIFYDAKEEKKESKQNFDFGDVSSDSLLFFIKPNILLVFKNNDWQKIALEKTNFSFDLFSSYFLNLYFLDKKNCQMIKYPHHGGSQWGLPETWSKNLKDCSRAKSMAIDGSIWILNNDNSLDHYYKGKYQKTIILDIFPFPKNIAEIKVNSSHLYLLEPLEKRIIITDKKGKIIKQFQSERFDDLKDFVVSKNGKFIYLLNGKKVYKIKLE